MATDTKLKIVVDAENRTQGVFNQLERNLDAIKKANHGLISTMQTVGLVGTAAFAGLSVLTKGIVEAGAGFEQTQIAFETMLGSAEVAKKTLRDLASFAARTPFELNQLEEASKRLLAYGTSADELIPTLEMLGNVSAGVGMDKLPQLILAFGQVKAATKLTGMELRQFSEAGVPLLGQLSQQLGVSVAEIQEMVSAGQIGFPEVQKALAALTGEGGRFNDLMEKQSHSLAGMWSNFKDQISLTARSIGLELMPYLKPLVEQLIGIAQAVGAFVKEHPRLSAIILVATLGFAAITAVLLPIAIALPGIILLFGGLAAAFAFIVSGPGLLIVGSIIAIVSALALIYQQGYFTKQAWEEVWTGIKLYAADGANTVVAVVEGMVNFLLSGINTAIRAINSVIKLAQKVPGFGGKISTMSEVKANFGRFDPTTIASSSLSSTPQSIMPGTVNITGNTFLDENSATKMGDLFMNKLKLSNAL